MTKLKDEVAKIIEVHEMYMEEIGGCGDGFCHVTGRAKGMHTNGGCRCWKDDMKMQRVGLQRLRLIKQLKEALTNSD